jgi:hypothetical protein
MAAQPTRVVTLASMRWRVRAVLPLLALALGMIWAAPANAEVVINERIPISATIGADCLGEPIAVEGFQMTVGTITEDASGGLHFTGHTNIHYSGTGLESGLRYQFANVEQGHDLIAGAEGAVNITLTEVIRVIRQGEKALADDRAITLTFHVTVNPNGEVTTRVDEFRSSCR